MVCLKLQLLILCCSLVVNRCSKIELKPRFFPFINPSSNISNVTRPSAVSYDISNRTSVSFINSNETVNINEISIMGQLIDKELDQINYSFKQIVQLILNSRNNLGTSTPTINSTMTIGITEDLVEVSNVFSNQTTAPNSNSASSFETEANDGDNDPSNESDEYDESDQK